MRQYLKKTNKKERARKGKRGSVSHKKGGKGRKEAERIYPPTLAGYSYLLLLKRWKNKSKPIM